jgi:hypothetical protein
MTTPDPSTTRSAAPAAPPADAYVARDIPCAACGYNLRTLPVTATCPECGASIDRTLRRLRRPLVPADHRRKLARGAVLLAAALPTGLATMLLNGLVLRRPAAPLLTALQVLVALALVLGAAWLSTADPRPRIRQKTEILRQALRSVLALFCLFPLLWLWTGWRTRAGQSIFAIEFLLAVAVLPQLLFRYTAAVAGSLRHRPQRRAFRDIAAWHLWVMAVTLVLLVFDGRDGRYSQAVPIATLSLLAWSVIMFVAAITFVTLARRLRHAT